MMLMENLWFRLVIPFTQNGFLLALVRLEILGAFVRLADAYFLVIGHLVPFAECLNGSLNRSLFRWSIF